MTMRVDIERYFSEVSRRPVLGGAILNIMGVLAGCVVCFVGVAVAQAGGAPADEAAQCQANDGTYITGRVTAGPVFRPGHERHGVELSHTHVTVLSDQDGQSYDVAIDDVFASGYDAAGESVPAPLSGIAVGDRLDLCGKLYTSGGPGIDWVHTDCGAAPTPGKPDGWVKLLAADWRAGPNLDGSQEYCSIF
jgi:hypothetical protein